MVSEGHLSAKPRRGYRKTRRAEDEMQTRAQIVDAAEGLHQTIGPARTSLSAIAAQAGVTRATVYRHFPDDESLFIACSSQWLSRQRLPNPGAWATPDDPLARLRLGLIDIYRYYRSGEQMLTLIHRDADTVPPSVKARREVAQSQWLEALWHGFGRRRSRKLQAAIGHAVSFETWRSLCITQGLSNRSAVQLMVDLVATAGGELGSEIENLK